MMIAPNSHARKEGKERGEVWENLRDEERNADYGGKSAPCV